ncbi:hypothetical protein ACFRFU_42045 [Streptomyces sp. NPDC056704]|uniref:hypothetical protein n=1 Tax=Streptomyces sp. NPDC056704 TaxID=3345917 RepID=UPI003689682A
MPEVSITPLAGLQIARLRAKDRQAYDSFLRDLRSQGCSALEYRLTGDLLEHLCVKHLIRNLRVVVAFISPDEAVVVLVGPHDDNDPVHDVYTLLYQLAGLEPPKDRRTKPACCGADDGLPPFADQRLVDDLVSQARALTRRQGRRR